MSDMPGGVLAVAAAALYLGLLSLIAVVVERCPRLRRLARHPISVGLALGVYATSWTFYGGVGFAATEGYNFLAISVGVALSCLAIPLVWRPLARVVRARQLQSAADLLAYRYQSRAVGAAVAVFMVAGLLPYLSLQMRAIADAARWLGDASYGWTGPAFAILLSLFAMGLGSRYAEPRPDRPGLLAALAVESGVKVLAITVVGAVTLSDVFGGLDGLDAWLAAHPQALADLYRPVVDGPWVPLTVLAFVAAFLLPRQFHVAFVERGDDPGLRHVMWVLPTLLLLLHLPLPIIYWAGQIRAPVGAPADVFVLLASERPGVRAIAFLGGISASSAMILVCAVALSGMVVNHLVLPLQPARGWIYQRLTALRRLVMAGLVFAGLAVHLLAPRAGTLADLGLVSFTAVLQLVPGIIGVLFWTRATRRGFVWGLCGGGLIWLLDAALPQLGGPSLGGALRAAGLDVDHRSVTVGLSLGLNSLLFAIGSLTAPPRRAEARAATFCRDPDAPPGGAVQGPDALRRRLAVVLGPEGARRQIDRFLTELGIAADERRPAELQRLSARVERALSGLVGPLAARALVGRGDAPAALAAELRFVSGQGRGATPPRGMQRALARVQRYLATVLDEMPVGVCALDDDGRVVVWNRALTGITGLDGDAVADSALADLPDPWGHMLREVRDGSGFIERSLGGRRPRILRLRSADLPEEAAAVLVVEDITARRQLRAQAAHQDRLASIGRLAAGVAHEIRNPLTGILMVARNLRLEPEADDAAERLDLVIGEAKRIDAIVRTLLGFSREGDGPARGAVDLAALVEDAVKLVRLGKRARALEWRVSIADPLTIEADRQALRQVLVNLLANARDAAGSWVEIALAAGADGAFAEIRITDDGPGVSPDAVERIFEPFFTSKPPGEGTGLGLAVCHRIVDEHRGHLELLADLPTTFRVRLPRVSSGPPPPSDPPLPSQPPPPPEDEP